MIKLTNLDDHLLGVMGEEGQDMPTVRTALRMIGNTKAKTADDARRITRLVRLLSTKAVDVEIAEEDLKAIKDAVEQNQMNLMAFFQGQLLDRLDIAAKG